MRKPDDIRETRSSFIHDTSGASIVIALVFFLICAIIGSVVVTAASVNAKAVQTQREMQQAEFAVGSAAQTVGGDLASAQVDVVPGEGSSSSVDAGTLVGQEFATAFWGRYGNEILKARVEQRSFSTDDMTVSQDSSEPVYGRLTVDRDLNVTVALSLDQGFSSRSPYNMTVTVQCVPTYDSAGRLLAFSYEQAVVQRASDAS